MGEAPKATRMIDQLRPLEEFTMGKMSFKKDESGEIRCIGEIGAINNCIDEYYFAVVSQMKVIHFIRTYEKEIKASIKNKGCLCTDPRTLLRNFDFKVISDLSVYKYRLEGDDWEIDIADWDKNGKFDYLQILDRKKQEVMGVYGDDFHPFVMALLELGVSECINVNKPVEEKK